MLQDLDIPENMGRLGRAIKLRSCAYYPPRIFEPYLGSSETQHRLALDAAVYAAMSLLLRRYQGRLHLVKTIFFY